MQKKDRTESYRHLLTGTVITLLCCTAVMILLFPAAAAGITGAAAGAAVPDTGFDTAYLHPRLSDNTILSDAQENLSDSSVIPPDLSADTPSVLPSADTASKIHLQPLGQLPSIGSRIPGHQTHSMENTAQIDTSSDNTSGNHTPASPETPSGTDTTLPLSQTHPAAAYTAYSLRDAGLMTSVLQQQSSNCWAYAVISAVESNAVKNGFSDADTTKFSELQLIWTLYNRTGITTAGSTLPELSGLEGDEIHALVSSQIWTLGSDLVGPAFHLMTGIGVVNEIDMPDDWKNAAYTSYIAAQEKKSGTSSDKKESGESTMSPDTSDGDDSSSRFPQTALPLEYAVNRTSYQITDFFTVPSADRKTVKEYLLEYGAGVVGYNSGAQYPVVLSKDDALSAGILTANDSARISGFGDKTASDIIACYQNSAVTYDHLAVIAGWNDAFPKTAFPEELRPENNGAWLIKGSWGAAYGDGGYYWISYEDTSLTDVLFFNGTRLPPADNIVRHLYQYDGGISTGSVISLLNLSIQNNFTAECSETLTAVSVYSPEKQQYLLSILIDGNETLNQTGVFDTPGYYTIPLLTPVSLQESDEFAVRVNLTTKGDYGYVSCDSGKTSSGCIVTTQSRAGQGIISWYDTTSRKIVTTDLKSKETSHLSSSGMNFRIKAVTLRSIDENTPIFSSAEEFASALHQNLQKISRNIKKEIELRNALQQASAAAETPHEIIAAGQYLRNGHDFILQSRNVSDADNLLNPGVTNEADKLNDAGLTNKADNLPDAEKTGQIRKLKAETPDT